MSILDRYVLRLFIKVLVTSFISLSGLIVMVDISGNLGEFISYGNQSLGGVAAVLRDYYAARLLTYFDLLSGLLSLVAAMFAVNWLQRTNELTAIMAAGISPGRTVKPLVFAACFVAVLGMANRELVVPRFQEKLARNAQDWLGEAEKPLEPRYDSETDILLAGRYTVAAQQKIAEPSFQLPAQLPGYGRKLSAANAYYRPPQGDRPGGYLLVGVQSPPDLFQLPSITMEGQPVVLSPRDTSWLQPDQCFVVSNVGFEQLAGGKAWRRYSGTWHLIRALRNPSIDYGADVRVTVHQRFVRPFLDLTLLMLGLPLVVTREQRNVFVAAGQCLLVVAGFFIVVLICEWLGSRSYLLTPAQAAWSPLIVLSPIAYTVAQRLRV